VRRAWQRAGLETRFSGTHILRHSLATRMKQEGVSLKFIADVLGHDSVQTTTLYAQVDLACTAHGGTTVAGGAVMTTPPEE